MGRHQAQPQYDRRGDRDGDGFGYVFRGGSGELLALRAYGKAVGEVVEERLTDFPAAAWCVGGGRSSGGGVSLFVTL